MSRYYNNSTQRQPSPGPQVYPTALSLSSERYSRQLENNSLAFSSILWLALGLSRYHSLLEKSKENLRKT